MQRNKVSLASICGVKNHRFLTDFWGPENQDFQGHQTFFLFIGNLKFFSYHFLNLSN
jgi:hypothetical protein